MFITLSVLEVTQRVPPTCIILHVPHVGLRQVTHAQGRDARFEFFAADAATVVVVHVFKDFHVVLVAA